MSRSRNVPLLGVQQPQILHLPGDVHSLDAATEAIELAESYGPPLDAAQKIRLYAGMGCRFDGKWAASHVGDAESRQNGKGDTLQTREAYGCIALREQIIHTAHEYPTAGKAFARMEAYLNGNRELRREVRKFRYANGEQGVLFKNGAEIMYRARTGGGSRGFDAVDLVVYDEAQHLRREHMAASAPTTATSPNYQLWFSGSAGFSFSEPWWDMRLAALRSAKAAGGDVEVPAIFAGLVSACGSVGGSQAWVENTAERVTLDDDDNVVSTSPDPEDPQTWAEANPAYGTRIEAEFFVNQLRLLGRDLALQEHGGVWDPLPPTDGVRREISEPAWKAQLDKNSDIVSTLSFAVAVAPEAESATIGCAGLREDGDAHVELTESRPGVRWLIPVLRRQLIEWHPWALAVDAAGPEKEILPDLRKLCEEVDVKLIEMTARQYAGACAGLVTGVVKEHTVWHLDDRALAGSVTAGRRRMYGDSWMWDTRVSTDVSGLKAVTLALRACREAPAELSEEFMGAWV